ncbi:MAG: molybdopterin molybdotransferase MoeA, partial [Cyanobacteria bacterium NC_groundwater_1444_Ag_S-0.65um_54_12]|nr:molybdopterin molybdotransferase MoeA [Cyanobacteria bacterium NC_groundwater_1444_Ag_S-0.65um_54_12]
GYAVRSIDMAVMPARLAVIGEVASAQCWERPLAKGEALRIMTGAPLPSGADAVVKVEDSEENNGTVLLTVPVMTGENVRPAGEDLRAGTVVLEPGAVFTPARIGMAAAIGRAKVLAIPRATVGIITTGNELVEPGQSLGPGRIRNTNAYALFAQVLAAGALPSLLGVCPDDYDLTVARLVEAVDTHDVVISSGGVSLGRHDHVGKALASIGEVKFTQVAQQPGKPLTFAAVRGKPVFALPGNPISTLVNFEIYVQPALRLLMGHSRYERRRMSVTLGEDIAGKPGRARFLRVVVADGVARLAGPQGSALWHTMIKANALTCIPAEVGALAAGSQLEVVMLDEV